MMLKKMILFIFMGFVAIAYDFGAVPKVVVEQIPNGKPTMVQFGKTECIWCEHMAPYFKEIKAKYPKTSIYYVNTDNDILGAINMNIRVLPASIFLDKEGKEIGRVEGYLLPDQIMELLKKYGVLVE